MLNIQMYQLLLNRHNYSFVINMFYYLFLYDTLSGTLKVVGVQAGSLNGRALKVVCVQAGTGGHLKQHLVLLRLKHRSNGA